MNKLVIVATLIFSLGANAWSENNSDRAFRLVREVVLEKGFVPDPQVIDRMSDGSFVIAGRMENDKAAWATAVEPDGVVRWRYLLPSSSPRGSGGYPYFSGIAAGPNGRTLLCGTIDLAVPPHSVVNGLLIQVDRHGHLATYNVIKPPQGENQYAQTAYIDGCTATRSGALLIGRVIRTSNDGKRDWYHWIVAANVDGQVAWQKLIPSRGGGKRSQIRKMSDDTLLIMDTEAILVDSQGELLARSAVTGLLRIVQPLNPHAAPELFGCYGGETYGRLFTLSEDLKLVAERTVARTVALCGPQQHVMQLFGLADGSMVLFGYRYDRGVYTPAAVKWNESLASAQTQLFSTPTAPWFDAAIPTGNEGEFATLRVTGVPTALGDDRERALYLSFIKISQ